MLSYNFKRQYSARIRAIDSEGSVYLYLGDNCWSIFCWQWGNIDDQVWWDTPQDVIEAIELAKRQGVYKPHYEFVWDSIEYLEKYSETKISICDSEKFSPNSG